MLRFSCGRVDWGYPEYCAGDLPHREASAFLLQPGFPSVRAAACKQLSNIQQPCVEAISSPILASDTRRQTDDGLPSRVDVQVLVCYLTCINCTNGYIAMTRLNVSKARGRVSPNSYSRAAYGKERDHCLPPREGLSRRHSYG